VLSKAPYQRSPAQKIRPILRALDARYGPQVPSPEDPLDVLVSGVLSQNTTDVNSDRAFESLVVRSASAAWPTRRRRPSPP
jgi:endonuclease III